ncbi:MAG: 30S ribosome-binding factor RbfA [Clostridiales bacterium]|jgi:ribosome-binding factor A|nr:30S ribosome-binding factor RbfA [Clostridiales bacterium]
MSELRLERVNEEMKKALGEILQREVKDPRLKGMCTVVRVRVTNDFEHARVYVSFLGGEDEAKEAMRALGQAGGFIARQAARRVRLRRTPRLEFIRDDSIAYGVYISRKIDEVMRGAGENGEEDA